MPDGRITIQFCGFGGQGVVLSSIIFGSAAVIGASLYAVQTQSYGSEARGGECQAELIVGKDPIGSPVSDQVDVLIAMSQMAFNSYIGRLKDGGTLVVDPQMVEAVPDEDVKFYEVPALSIAEGIGAKIAANMVMLGFLQQAIGLITEEHLIEAICASVPRELLDVNLRAARRGVAWAKERYGMSTG